MHSKTLLLASLSLLAMGCSGKDDPAEFDAGASDAANGIPGDSGSKDSGVSVSIACYIADQYRCKEFPEATAEQQTNLPVECSSASGVLTNPAACPTASFGGKCTVGTGPGREVRRAYSGADLAYEADFCVNTAGGVWSTTF